ncbi:hypothetical protein BSGG_4454 [Bacteroides sp. D2]|nr:hypothetical protein BSGG_4454 [Bacteroides sp. D2]
MVSTIEDDGIYDGRGTFDLYQCEKCSREKITTYADKGVTPFIIRCDCGGNMQHTKTFKSVPDYIRVFKWKRPTLEQTIKLSDGQIEHILNGGLVLDTDIYTPSSESVKKSLEKIPKFIPPLTRQQRRKMERESKKKK